MNEIWRKTEYEFYEISNQGNCRSVDHYGWSRHHIGMNRLFKGKLLKGDVGDFGKLRYCLGGRKVFAHILVAKAFPEICGVWYDGCDVHHKDYNPSNNEATNLVVLSPEEHRKLHTSIGQMAGANNPFYGRKHKKETVERVANKHKKQIDQFDLNNNYVKTFGSVNEAAQSVDGVASCLIKCLKGKWDYYKGFKWSYASSPVSSSAESA